MGMLRPAGAPDTSNRPTIWHLNPEDVEQLADALYWAAGEARPIRLCIDGGVKVDVGDGAGWSLPYGKANDSGR